MAYNKQKLYNQAIEAIEKNNLFFIEDIIAFIPCVKPTFYEMFPLDSDEMNTIKSKLESNKIKTKSAIRAKLYKGNKAAELIALYKLICTDEERKNLQLTYTDNKHTITDKRKTIDELFPDDGELIEGK